MSKAISKTEIMKVREALKRHSGSIMEVVRRTNKNKSWVSRVLAGKCVNKNGELTSKSGILIIEKAVDLVREWDEQDDSNEQVAKLKEKIATL